MVPLWVVRYEPGGLVRRPGSCVGEFAEREPRMDPKHNPNDELLDASGDVTGTIELATEGALALNVAADPSAPVTREQRRSRRKRAIRARTISVKRMTKRELELGRLLYPDTEEFAKPVARE